LIFSTINHYSTMKKTLISLVLFGILAMPTVAQEASSQLVR